MTQAELPFPEVWLTDFEFVARPGERPDVVCLAAHELRSGRTLRFWRDELGDRPPYRTDRDALIVNFVANAECACHLSLGWPLPERVLDLSPVFRNLTNGLSTPEGKGLIGALRYFGIDTISTKQKDAVRQRIMQGFPFTPEERERILTYCASDVDAYASPAPAHSAGDRSGRRAPSWRVRRRVRSDGAPRRSDRHGGIFAARRP